MYICDEYDANLIIGTVGRTQIHKKYACANYFNRGTYGNDLYIRRDILEERLLGRLQRELLRPEVIDYTVAEFGRQLRAALSSMSNDLGVLRRRKEQLEGEIERFADGIARGGPLDALVPQIAVHRAVRRELYRQQRDRKSTRLNPGHTVLLYALFCLQKPFA